MKIQIKIKRVYDKPSESDGLRVLVDKFWPRGVKKIDLPYDIWAKGIVPSDVLRQTFHKDIPTRFDEFAKQYAQELRKSEGFHSFIQDLKTRNTDTLTLLYASRFPKTNHALVLQKEIERVLK